jgi:hypothetical protein
VAAWPHGDAGGAEREEDDADNEQNDPDRLQDRDPEHEAEDQEDQAQDYHEDLRADMTKPPAGETEGFDVVTILRFPRRTRYLYRRN